MTPHARSNSERFLDFARNDKGQQRVEKKDPLAEEFLRYLAVERNASARTLKAYRQALAAFRVANKTPWKKSTADDFRDYLFALMKRQQARSYVRLQFSALRTMLPMSIFTPSRCAFLAKAERNAFVRLVCPRSRRSRDIARRQMCIQALCS